MPVGNPYYFEGDINYFSNLNFNYPADRVLDKEKKSIYSYLNDNFNL